MRAIKSLFEKEIDNGSINWLKLESKIHGALMVLENKYTASTLDGKKVEAKWMDALDFPCVNKDTNIKRCYRIIKPRLINGKLMCSGLQIGVFDKLGKPVLIQKPEMF